MGQKPKVVADDIGRLSFDSEENTAHLTTWVFEEGTFVPQAKIVDGKSYSIISDYLGTPILSYDENGRKVWERELDIYGKARKGDSRFIPFLYQGQYYDAETELAYNRFRYYSPDTGTYISQDPIGLASGEPNFYAYVADSNTWIDPFGLYAGEGVRDLGAYNSFFDADLPQDIWKGTDGKHFKEANKQLYEAMENNLSLKKNLAKKYPGVFDHVQPGPRGGFSPDSPPGMTWHHNNKPGKLELVDRADHKKFHKVYHPDGSGGRKKWGGGRNKFKRKPKTH